MFFIFSKTVAYLLLPSNLVVVVALAGLALMATRSRCAGTRMMVVSLILFVARFGDGSNSVVLPVIQ
jgi:hypothetical protein